MAIGIMEDRAALAEMDEEVDREYAAGLVTTEPSDSETQPKSKRTVKAKRGTRAKASTSAPATASTSAPAASTSAPISKPLDPPARASDNVNVNDVDYR